MTMTCKRGRVIACAAFMGSLLASISEAQERRIEEVVVTAEKREATVSDTSISITAFGEQMIEDFGLQGADELVNFIPATTRDAYDIRIRGVGRNFRALGGDPGVATYYNGVYSEDFGIASSENGLYDVERIEVLRGPQGTLYGRNSIGGALNYITNKPSYEFEGELRTLQGNMGTQEYYGILSGPIVPDRLAARVVGVMRDRDGSYDGMNGSDEVNDIHDSNVSVALQWRIAENWEMNVRWNDRSSDRVIGSTNVITEGLAGERDSRNTANYARGGAIAGVTVAPTAVPNPGFGLTGLRTDTDLEDLNGDVATNDDNNERFDQNAVQFELAWDINDTTSLKYLGGWMDFDYTFDIDLDFTNGTFAQPRQTVLEAVETSSHELQLLWQVGENLQMTSGLYYFTSDRLQNYAFRDLHSQGRFTDPTIYGGMAGFLPFVQTQPTHARRGDSPVGAQVLGPWEGDATGAYYEYWNKVKTDAMAVYTQGTYSFNEQWALTIGARWAKDEKDAFEDRTGYFELNPAALEPFVSGACATAFGFDCTLVGLTPLAITNIFMGSASPTFDPSSPIAPTCGLTDPNCATPLRLAGIPFSFADRAQGDDDWGDTSFRVNVDWTPNEDTLVYASVTTGYRAGGYSLGIGDSRGLSAGGLAGITPLAYDQEEVLAYELGYKATFLAGQLQFNASLYQYTYDNYQDRIEIASPASSTSLDQVVNADEAENMGFEFEFTWLASEHLTVGGNGSFTRTEYTSDLFVLEDDNPFITPVVRNLKGNDLKRIPELKYTLWASYDWNFASGTLTAGFTHSFTGEYYSSGIKRNLDKVPDRRRTDVRLTWRDNKDRWNISAFVDNVFDEIYTRGIGTDAAANDYRLTGEMLYPRFYGLEVTYRLDG